jgi:uncharacterized SAM-binding protein YcdF (DUF218 family)
VSAGVSTALVVPGHSRFGRLSGRCRRVLDAAAELATERGERLVVLTGRSRWGPAEGDRMAAAWRGGPDVELVVEATARTTAENAARSLELLRARGVRRATVVCAPAQTTRARYLFRRLGASAGVECEVLRAWRFPTPLAVAWELAALPLAPRQGRAALARVRAARGA